MENTTWLQDIANNKEFWNERVMEQAPSVIAHEYHRLREMGKHGQVFGFILQLKDVMESILKFQVLLMAAFGQTKEGSEEAYAYHFAERVLSMGAWLALGSEINTFCGEHNDYPEALQNSWDCVLSAFSGQHWVAWRNAVIAHGALAFDADQYKQEITDKLGELKDLLDELIPYYLQMKVVDEYGEYTGCLRARNLEQENGEMLCRIGKETELPLSNYILHRNHGIYFFDAITSGSMANCLSYPEGDHWQEAIAYWNQVDQLYKEGQISGATPLSTEDITNVLNEAVNRISLSGVHRFIRPEYLVNWLKQSLSQNSRGVFLLTMDRGCGKSAFTEKLNRLYAKPLELSIENKDAKKDVIDVRTYHISRTQTMKASQFTAAVSNLWRKAYQDPNEKYKAVEFEEQALMFMPKEDEVPAEAFANYLNNVRKKTQVHRLKKRILFVLDGLDEIIPDAEKIWDYIPAPDLLDAGVYILLTGRNVDEQGLPTGYRQRIERLQINASLKVSAQMQENKQFLRNYIKEQLSTGQCKYTDAIANKVIELSGGRVLYARMYVQLLASGKYRVEELADAENIIPAYLERLKQRYGEKGWKQMVKLLTVFATMYDVDSLTLDEIAWLMGESGPTLLLLGMLSDISCMLNVERGYAVNGVIYAGENQYRLSDALVAVALLGHLNVCEQPEFCMITETIMERTLRLIHNGTMADVPGYLLALSCIIDYREKFLSKKESLTENELKQLRSTIEFVFERDFDTKIYNRIANALEQVLKGGKLLMLHGKKFDEEFFAETQYVLSKVFLSALKRWRRAIEYSTNSIQIYEKLMQEDKLLEITALSESYCCRAGLFLEIYRYEDALADYARSIKISNNLWSTNGNAEIGTVLAFQHIERGNAYEIMNNLENALSDYAQSIEILKYLKRKGLLADESDLISAYHQRSMVLGRMKNWKDAMSDLNCSLNIAIEINSGVDIASSYYMRASILVDMQQMDKALVDYTKSINILEQLDEDSMSRNKRSLAMAYQNRSMVFSEMNQQIDALKDYEHSIRILEELQKMGYPGSDLDLAQAYRQFAKMPPISDEQIDVALERLDISNSMFENNFKDAAILEQEVHEMDEAEELLWEDAFEDYDVCVNLVKHLKQSYANPNRIAEAILIRGAWQMLLDNYDEEALEDLDWCIEFWESCCKRNDNKLYESLEENLAKAYLTRGNIMRHSGRINEALEDYECCIEIGTSVEKKRKLIFHKDIVQEAYQQRDNLLQDIRSKTELNRLEAKIKQLLERNTTVKE